MWDTHTHTHTHTHIYTHIHTYMYIYVIEYYSAIKKWNTAICSNMHGPRDYPIKWSQSEIERQIPYDITYMGSLKKWYK